MTQSSLESFEPDCFGMMLLSMLDGITDLGSVKIARWNTTRLAMGRPGQLAVLDGPTELDAMDHLLQALDAMAGHPISRIGAGTRCGHLWVEIQGDVHLRWYRHRPTGHARLIFLSQLEPLGHTPMRWL